ncbi:MAG: sensor histidine kinase, partial [Acidobacteriota bacterium]
LQQSIDAEGSLIRIDIPLISKSWTLEKDETPIHVTEVEHAGLQNPVRKWLVIICVFTALALFFTIQRMIVYSSRGESINWPQHLLDYSGWYIWALITPVVLKISSKYPLQRREWWKCGAIHFVAFVASWVVATLAMDAVRWGSNLGSYNYFASLPVSFARSPITLDVLCYSAIVAVESALRYRRRYEAGTVRTLRLAAQLSRAKLDALKMQLHPHFLFNSLNSLSELMQEDPGAAEVMIRNLEMFLRLTVHQNHLQEIPFGKEMEFLQCYLAIENVRYQDRLNVTMDIEPQAMDVPVPNLLLQPIVENAIRHGIAPRSTPGHIDIQAKRDNGVLALQVRDNGPGMSKSMMKSASFRSGLGLSNTRERLTQLYGNRHRFELVNAPEGGLIVSVEIPVGNPKKR